jgi:ferritin-like metal-binding protein YciE
MGLLSQEFNNLNDLLVHELKDLYDAEQRLTQALPEMAEAAHSQELKQAFLSHLAQTKTHVSRLEQVFGRLNEEAERDTCPAMKGLIAEGEEIIKAKGDPATLDAGLIAAAQKVEHYEIASYGTVRNFAMRLGYRDVADTLQMTLDEEGQADKLLTRIAESSANAQAASH